MARRRTRMRDGVTVVLGIGAEGALVAMGADLHRAGISDLPQLTSALAFSHPALDGLRRVPHRCPMSLAPSCVRCSAPVVEAARRHLVVPGPRADQCAVAPAGGVVRRVRGAPARRRRLPDVRAVADEPGLDASPTSRAVASMRRGATMATLTCTSGTSELDGPVDVLVVAEEAGTGLGARCAGTRYDDPGCEIGDAAADGAGADRQPGRQPLGHLDEQRRRRVRPFGAGRRGRGPVAVDRAAPGVRAAAAARRLDPARRVRRRPAAGRAARSADTARAGDSGTPRVERVRIDLHTHSRASDGTDTPAELVRAARRRRARRPGDHRPRHRRRLGRGERGARRSSASRWCRAWRSAPATTAAACTCSPTCPTRPTRRWPTS